MTRRRSLTLVPLILAGLFALFQYFSAEKVTIPETGRSVRVAMSSEREAALGLQSYREVLSQSEVVTSGREYEIVERVARRLANAIGPAGEGFDWQVAVIRSDQINAFCLPGGKIAVYTGILPVAETEEGLAAVMGHENGARDCAARIATAAAHQSCANRHGGRFDVVYRHGSEAAANGDRGPGRGGAVRHFAAVQSRA